MFIIENKKIKKYQSSKIVQLEVAKYIQSHNKLWD